MGEEEQGRRGDRSLCGTGTAVICELSAEEIARVDAVAVARGLTREVMLGVLVEAGLPEEEAQALGKRATGTAGPSEPVATERAPGEDVLEAMAQVMERQARVARAEVALSAARRRLGSALASHFASPVMSSAVTVTPSSLRSRFSRRILSENGNRATSTPESVRAPSR